MNRKKTTAGYSLTEILVALVISSILMYGVISILISSKRTYGLQDEMAKLQDNARFVMEDLAYSLRMTRFKGCAGHNDEPRNPFLKYGADPNFKMIDGENNKPITDIYGQTFSNAKYFPPSDTLTLRFLSTGIKFDLDWYGSNNINGGQYSPATLDLSDRIYLSRDSFIPDVGQPMVVIDCRIMTKTTVVEKNTVKIASNDEPEVGSPYIRVTPVLPTDSTEFKRPIDIFSMNLSSMLYEVKWNPVAQNFALYKENANDPKYEEPFIEGVENLQLRYGRETATGVVYGESPTDGGDVLSVRITLLMRTVLPRYDLEDATDKDFFLDKDLSATSIPGLSGGKYNPFKNVESVGKSVEGHYRHRLFTTTVQLRNK